MDFGSEASDTFNVDDDFKDGLNDDLDGEDDGFNPDGTDGGIEDDDDFVLQGYDDVHVHTPDVDYSTGPAPKRARPAFFSRSTKAAQRSDLRSKYDEGNSFLVLEGEEAEVIKSQPSRVPGTFGRRNREKGSTLAAYHKKVSADLDSDDELMMDMREKGYSDRQIAEKLARDGRVRYDMKSISTRIVRIRQAQAEHVDYLLKEGYMEWKQDDDQLLLRAYELADIEIRYEMERLRAWRFRKVSDFMRRLNKNAIFSATACSDRYISIIDGTAKIPSDIDDDPMARRAEMDAFITKRELERAKEHAAKEKKKADARRIKDDAKARQAKKSADTAAKRNFEAKDKANRAVMRAVKNQLKSQKAEENMHKKNERKARIEADKKKAERNKTRKDRQEKLYSKTALQGIDANSPDPRADLNLDDLELLCAHRGLEVEGDKDELLEALNDADTEFTHNELRDMIKKKGITPAPNKMYLRYQLALWEARNCQGLDQGLESDDEATGDESEDDEEGGEYSERGTSAGGDDDMLDFGDGENDKVLNFD
ncbi:hypothetical protein P280DRAFT_390970 [Massarina eburnea CBS 473.64]|uniref:SAP domain-containing protein n=1 Tax=Massarina eburnea CBS 473.64 TaxID=1395130 RepID=A0A6A6SEE9_9PLEO|nr:hypothetical protein P280DRAFT_390970 [Massarina eburnea CBS 473.64]